MGVAGRCGIALLAGLASGCSFVWAETVSDAYHPSQTPRCTESRGFAFGDAITAGSIGALAVLAATDEQLQEDGDADGLTIVLGGFAALYAASTWFGFSSSSDCRHAFDRHDAWLAERKPAPGRGPPGTHPPIALKDEPAPTPAAKVQIGPDGQVCQRNRSANPEVNSRHGRARAAAATGDCAAVREHAAAIEALDAGYYSSVFRCDAAILKACEQPSP